MPHWNYWIWEDGWRVLAVYPDRDVHYFRAFLEQGDNCVLCQVGSKLDCALHANPWDRYAENAVPS